MGKLATLLAFLAIFNYLSALDLNDTNKTGRAQSPQQSQASAVEKGPHQESPPHSASAGQRQAHDWIDKLNAASTAVIAFFTIALFWGIFYQASNTRNVERAWIIKEGLSSPAGLDNFSPTYINPAQMRVTLALKNNGRTPAKITESSASFELVDAEGGLPDSPLYRPEASSSKYPKGGLIVVPNDVVTVDIDYADGKKRFEPADFQKLRDGLKVLAIWGFVAYRDAFERPHKLCFCYLYKPRKEANVWRGEFKLDGPSGYNRHT